MTAELVLASQTVTIIPPENPSVRDNYDKQQHQNGR